VQIKTTEFGAFNGLTKLLDMSVSGNEIHEVTPHTFENMSRLEYLDLAYYKIVNLEVNIFCRLVNLKRISGVPRGVWGVQTPTPRNSEVLRSRTGLQIERKMF
jgi:hypothetical protein